MRDAGGGTAVIFAIAAPVIAFYRLMKPVIGKRHCPATPDWMRR